MRISPQASLNDMDILAMVQTPDMLKQIIADTQNMSALPASLRLIPSASQPTKSQIALAATLPMPLVLRQNIPWGSILRTLLVLTLGMTGLGVIAVLPNYQHIIIDRHKIGNIIIFPIVVGVLFLIQVFEVMLMVFTQSLRANEEGIQRRRILRPPSVICWQDVELWLMMPGAEGTTRYILAGKEHTFSWNEPAEKDQPDRYRVRAAELCALIASHTGLILQDIAKK